MNVTYDILSVLPDKCARFLLEFHAHLFESLDLPFLPADRSDFDVHGALLDDKVHTYITNMSIVFILHIDIYYNNYIHYINYTYYIIYISIISNISIIPIISLI